MRKKESPEEMPTEILMPALSPTMEEGKLAKWLVKEGQTIKPGDIIAEIETDKATMEVEAVDEGKVSKLLVAEGTEGVKVNTPIAVLDGGAAAAPSKAAAPQPAAAKPAPAAAARAPATAAVASPPPQPSPARGEGANHTKSSRRFIVRARLHAAQRPRMTKLWPVLKNAC